MDNWFIINGRTAAGLSQDQLAKFIGVSVKTVKRWEAGKCEPMFVNQKAIRAVFKYKPNPTSTNAWSKSENQRRYFLHRRIKGVFLYSAKGRTIQVTEDQVWIAGPVAERALVELRDKFKYNIQFCIT